MEKQPDAPLAHPTDDKGETLTYTSALAELQQIVRELQEEIVSIDALSAKIERASALIRFCRERLRQTEAEVARLTDSSV